MAQEYVLKQIPEDFIVEEVIDLNLNPKGPVTYFKLEKKLWNSFDAVQEVAKATRIRMSKFRFAGNKDKQACTTQFVSAYQLHQSKIEKLNLHNIKVSFVGRGDTPINLGTNLGNKFDLIIRNIKSRPAQRKIFINLFGDQRFGTDNVEGGRALAQKQFKKAVDVIKSSKNNSRQMRHSNNPINTLRSMPKKIIIFYLHAYQSYLWNETVLGLLEDNPNISKTNPDIKVPLIGFGFEEDLLTIKDKQARETILKITKKIMKRENINFRDFVFREFPELSSEGGLRFAFVKVSDLKVGSLEPDELNENMKKVRVKFFLPKGSYATEFIKQLFNEKKK